MNGFVFILQSQPPLATAPSGLAIANNIALTVLLVGLGLAILIASNYYRRREGLEALRAKRKLNESKGSDLISQFPFMSREELKEMILKEKESQASTQPDESTDKKLITNADGLNSATIEIPDNPTSQPAPSQEASQPAGSAESNKMNLLIDLSLASAKEAAAKEPDKEEKSFPPVREGVERSALSNELPEEFKRKSRKI
jgi:hypothetical protein